MKVAFRADASVTVGSGHVMRCLALADALHEQGADTYFLCRDEPGHLGTLIESHGHRLAWLPKRDTLASDAVDCDAILAEEAPWDWLVVDHYLLDATWEGQLRTMATRIMVIDDLANRPHDCDLLLDQNLQEPSRYVGLVLDSCISLIGPRYALLRPQFGAARTVLPARTGGVARLLVFCGGADADGETLKVLAAIDKLGRADLAIDVVIGQANPHRAAIEAACRDLATLHCQVEDMATLMASADLFIGAGGTSSWERCCLGLPAVVWAVVENQVAQSRALARAGAQLYLGPAEAVTAERLAAVIEEVLGQPALLEHLAGQAAALVDGQGVSRVASHMQAAALELRRAEPGDSASIYAWRNHPDSRRHAFDPTEIDRARHERWFAAVLADPDRELLVAERDGQPVGVLRYDIKASLAMVSVYLVPGLAGRGWGKRLLLAGERWLRDRRPEVQACEAEIAAGNAASLAVFRATGFLPYRSVLRKELHGNR